MSERDPRAQRHVKPCPENGKSHDCNWESIEGMPVETFDDLIRLARLDGLAEGWDEGLARASENRYLARNGQVPNPYRAVALRSDSQETT